jgi:hypothetical protein
MCGWSGTGWCSAPQLWRGDRRYRFGRSAAAMQYGPHPVARCACPRASICRSSAPPVCWRTWSAHRCRRAPWPPGLTGGQPAWSRSPPPRAPRWPTRRRCTSMRPGYRWPGGCTGCTWPARRCYGVGRLRQAGQTRHRPGRHPAGSTGIAVHQAFPPATPARPMPCAALTFCASQDQAEGLRRHAHPPRRPDLGCRALLPTDRGRARPPTRGSRLSRRPSRGSLLRRFSKGS